MKVLVTGAAGYIGSVLCPSFLQANHEVVGLDNFRYGPQAATALAACCADPRFTLIRGDARDTALVLRLMNNVNVVIPLAAIVGAPACVADPNAAVSTNRDAIRTICNHASKDQMIVYPNTNSMYGAMMGSNAPLDEDIPGWPLSLYAESKCDAETWVRDHQNAIVFRLATVFGASPRMRTDLLVNDFVLRAARDRVITLYEPYARRNFVHVRDVADAFLWAIENNTNPDAVYNLGHDGSNITKMRLCELIRLHVPDLEVNFGAGADPDKRDYVVSNARLAAAGFTATRTLNAGIKELLKLYCGFPQTAWGNV